MFRRSILLLALTGLPAPALASKPCPTAVKEAVKRLHPTARLASCKPEKDQGKLQYEVKISSEGKPLELDLTPEGLLLQTEEKVPLGSLPAGVLSAFRSRYAGIEPLAAERQTKADGKTTFEVAFERDRKRREATFSETGSFVEEE